MKEAKAAVFNFLHYRINEFSLSNPGYNFENLAVKFEPSGRLEVNSQLFNLSMLVTMPYGGDTPGVLLTVKMDATFKFTEKTTADDIPDYFYRNIIAIVFPYLRAFITTLTSIAGMNPVILPLLNLSELEEPLRQNTTSV